MDYGYDIEITVNHLDFESSSGCQYDSLHFATDRNFNQTVVKICNRIVDSRNTYTAHGHQLFVKFESDENVARSGFNVSYRQVASSCGGSFVSQKGVISTRNYPKQNYEDNAICEWDIKTDIAHSLTFQLIQFDIESSSNCRKDKLEIIDPVFNQTLWLGCGSLDPNKTIFESQRNELLIRLTSDDKINAKGFTGNYSQSCGSRIIVTEPGLFKFQQTPRDDGRPISCMWNFIAKDPSKKITLTFTRAELSLGAVIVCSIEVKVFDGDSILGPLRQKFCTSKVPPTIVSNGNALTVQLNTIFQGDMTIEASYSVLDNCE